MLPIIIKPMNFDDINPLNKYDNIWVMNENPTWAFNLELPSGLASNFIFFSIIFILSFLFENIRSKRTLNPELANRKNFSFNKETLPAKNPVSGSEIFVDK